MLCLCSQLKIKQKEPLFLCEFGPTINDSFSPVISPLLLNIKLRGRKSSDKEGEEVVFSFSS